MAPATGLPRATMRPIAHLQEIAGHFPPGCRVVLHSACAVPPRLTAQLIEVTRDRGPFALFDMTTVARPAFVDALESEALRLTTFVPGRAVRSAYRSGLVRLVRRPLSQAPSSFRDGDLGVDVLLLQVSPPDARGMMTLGISCDAMRAALACASLVVAEISPDMPRTCGDTRIRPEQVHYVVENGGPPLSPPETQPDATDEAIADNVAALIRSGDVLQTGIGSIPDLIAARLQHLSDLGLHTGILTEAVRPLIARGVVTNATKARFQGRSIATMAAGSPSFYRFLHENAAVEFHPCDLTHDAGMLAGIRGLCAINGALEIDLRGRINAESVGARRVSGPGGQPDFAAGAARARDGKSIIVLRATSRTGEESRIVPALDAAAAVTIDTRSATHVVTEFGVASVRGLTGGALQRALATVAAPAFRAELLRA